MCVCVCVYVRACVCVCARARAFVPVIIDNILRHSVLMTGQL